MKIQAIFISLLSVLLLSSCNHTLNKGQSGAIMGAAGGAIVGQAVGHDSEATIIGALIGTMVGYMVGNEMDKYDREQLNHVYERGVSGNTSSWVNPDSGHVYNVTPKPARTGASGPCREAQIEAIIDGQRQTTYTTACRDYNGQWVLQ